MLNFHSSALPVNIRSIFFTSHHRLYNIRVVLLYSLLGQLPGDLLDEQRGHGDVPGGALGERLDATCGTMKQKRWKRLKIFYGKSLALSFFKIKKCNAHMQTRLLRKERKKLKKGTMRGKGCYDTSPTNSRQRHKKSDILASKPEIKTKIIQQSRVRKIKFNLSPPPLHVWSKDEVKSNPCGVWLFRRRRRRRRKRKLILDTKCRKEGKKEGGRKERVEIIKRRRERKKRCFIPQMQFFHHTGKGHLGDLKDMKQEVFTFFFP